LKRALTNLLDNAVKYGKRAQATVHTTAQAIEIVIDDEGPGIPDVTRALTDGYSTSGGLGLGLPGARRLMDEFEIVTDVGRGTTVTMSKLKRPQR